jgi:2-methylcitrate dehydratase PrpD
MTGAPTVVAALARTALAVRAGETERIRPAARAAFIDWLAVALGGSQQPITAALLEGLGPGQGPSRIVGLNTSLPAPMAALVNGTAAHMLELDDIYAPGLFHPGAPVIAAALAVADRQRASVGRLMRAVVVGYEVGCRLAADLGPSHYAHWHTTGTAGAVAAAAAATDLRDADVVTVAHALSLAATTTGGLQQTFRSNAAGKPLHAGTAAQAGVVAAAAALGGVTGASDIFEGPAGFAAATGTTTDWAASRDADVDKLAIEQVTVKPFPCCGHAFAPIDGAAQLHGGVDPANVERIDVATYASAISTAGIAEPRTDAERRFSIQYLVAAALVFGPEGMFGAAAAADSTVRRIAARVRLVVDGEMEARFPAHRGARLKVVLADGRQRAVDVLDRPGSPERPLDADRLAEKFVATSAVVRGNSARSTYAALLHLDGSAPVSVLDLGGAVIGR